MEAFKNLTPESLEKLLEAPALVTILVGAADGNLDGEERNWSEKLLRAKSYSGQNHLKEYYRIVAERFWVEVQTEMTSLPVDINLRNELLSQRLSALNEILPQLSPVTAYYLYRGLLSLAAETAKASGGFLRIGAVSSPEQDWVLLPMLHPIPAPPDLPEHDNSRFDENIWGEKENSAI